MLKASILVDECHFDAGDTQYPCELVSVLPGMNFTVSAHMAVYGIVPVGGYCDILSYDTSRLRNVTKSSTLHSGWCFVLGAGSLVMAKGDIPIVLFVRHGFNPLEMFSRVETVGRLSYIDGCSDTVLIPPPRRGDACLNHLHFPVGILQTQHIHPTVRLGLVLRGAGRAYCDDPNNTWEHPLKAGDVFCIDPQERHSFRTDLDGSTMDIIAFHPDSDVGPTDTSHPMLSRTLVHHGGGK